MNPLLQLRSQIVTLKKLKQRPAEGPIKDFVLEQEIDAVIADLEAELAIRQRHLDEAIAAGARMTPPPEPTLPLR